MAPSLAAALGRGASSRGLRGPLVVQVLGHPEMSVLQGGMGVGRAHGVKGPERIQPPKNHSQS